MKLLKFELLIHGVRLASLILARGYGMFSDVSQVHKNVSRIIATTLRRLVTVCDSQPSRSMHIVISQLAS